ncbi:hypothetical protein J3R30DRAFT_3407577 [Lentinula aciculospora]|uniref:Uncharacterized protein n=1 Tax=Lentinula aciculospora TaxID=153920 RepID=A0A9W9DIG5_9AGAR|nr:hypothetical protein J3R30DRAFT_3407577 [Lentinula aciculospora]
MLLSPKQFLWKKEESLPHVDWEVQSVFGNGKGSDISGVFLWHNWPKGDQGIYLQWPGYLHRRWMVSLPLYDDFGEEILWTKKGLGTFLAFQYREFAESCTRGHIICKEPTWRIGSGGIAFQDMRIVTFWNITKDIWRAEITVDVPSNGWAESRQDYYSLTGAEGCYNKIRPEGKDKRCPSCSTVHRCDQGIVNSIRRGSRAPWI